MIILFTRNNTVLSRIIRGITGEEVSHCAICISDYVIHINLLGLQVQHVVDFSQNNIVVDSIPIHGPAPADIAELLEKLVGNGRMGYDYLGLLYLGLRYLLPGLVPKQNLWQVSGMFLCTEFVTNFLDGREASTTTPGQLALYLKDINENG